MRVFLCSIGLALALACAGPRHEAATITIFAAASLQTALDDIHTRLVRPHGQAWRLTYAGTPALARQIDAGAPADVFIAADEAWMDHLQFQGRVQASTRVDLVGNTLVLIAPADTTSTIRLGDPPSLRAALGDGRLAIADPASVPAGRYAREALTHLDLWPLVAERLAPHENVRAALMLVARAEAPLGVVYHSDAADEPRVRVMDRFPVDSHAPIRYPAALTTRARADAGAVLTLLTSPEARAVFARHGFAPLDAAR